MCSSDLAEEGVLTHDEYVGMLATGTRAVQDIMADLTRQLSVIQGM